MADTFSTARLNVAVDTRQFSRDIRTVSSETERALANMKLSADAFDSKWTELTAGIKDTRRIISGILISQGFYVISNALVEAGTAAIQFSANMETAAISMEYFVEGAEKAAKAAAYLRSVNEFAARTPFTTEGTLALSKYMQAVGVSMNTTKSFLGVITDAAAATGATEENLQRIVFGLGQMMTKGRLANEEIRQLANANVPIYEILQEELGLTGEQISNIGKNWVKADTAVVAILRGLEKRYDGAADRIAETVTGMTDTIKDDAKILAQVMSAGVYNNVAESMTNIRDTLDRYRETATTQGSMGLFDQLLREADASGEVGTMILNVIGNTDQLIDALHRTYIAAAPLVSLFGKSIYTSISVVEITLTSFSQIVNGAVDGLNKLGVTTGTTAEIMSSLFIAYKASKWMGLLGQGAVSAAYSLYQTTTATMSVVPATMKASAGAKILTASLAGLVTYGAAAYSIFKMLNGAMSGLGATTGDNILPDSYTAAMDKYQTAMDEYNEKIAQYQEAYNTPYTSIADGASAAIDSLNAVADASSAAAGSVKGDWTAAFDEVYTIPDQSGLGGSGSAAEALFPDFGELLSLPAFSFPGIGEEALTPPEFPWSDVLGNGLLDSEVLEGDWWKSLLPLVIAGGAIQLGKIFANANKPVVAGLDEAMKSTKEAILATREAQKEALLSVGRDFDEISDLLTKTISELHNPRLRGEERALLERNLDKLIAAGEKTANKLDDVQDAMLLTGRARRSTAVLDQAKQQDAIIKIEHTLDRVETIQKHLADMQFAQTTSGHAAIQELKQLKETAVKQYVAYAGRYGSDAAFEQIAHDLGISMPNLNSGVDALKKNLGDLITIAEGGFKESEKAQQLIKESRNVLKTISDDAAIIGAHVEGIDKLQSQFKLLSDGLKASGDATVNKELLNAVRNVLSNREALEELKLLRSSAVAKLEDMSIKYAENAIANRQLADAISDIAITFDEVRFSVAALRQSQLKANKLYANTINKIVSRQLPSIMATMAKVDRYGAEIMRSTVEGKNAVIGMQKKIDVAIGSIEAGTEQLRGPLEAMKETAVTLLDSSATTSKLVQKHYNDVVDALVEIGKNTKADAAAIDKAIDGFSDAVETGISKSTTDSIEAVIRQIGEGANPAVRDSDEVTRALWRIHDDLLESSKDAATYQRRLVDKTDDFIYKYAAQNNVDVDSLFEKYDTALKAMYSSAPADFAQTAGGAPLISDYVTKEQFGKATDKIGIELANIPAEQADRIGKGIRTEATHLLEELEASNADEWKNFVRVIEEGGIFDLSKALATGGNFGALKLGQTSFGNTASTAMIDNLKSSILKDMFPGSTASATNMKAAQIGIESEEFAKRILAEYMLDTNKLLYKTSTYVDETRKVIVQLDAAVGDMNKAQYPIDVKVLGSKSYNKLVKSMEAIGEAVDARTIKLTTEGFQQLLAVMPDYALQIAAQAQTLGTSTAALAVFDHETTGLVKTMQDVSKLDVTTKQGTAQLVSAVRTAIMDGISKADTVNAFSGSLKVLEFEIPDSAKELVVTLAEDLRKAEMALSKFAASGATVDDLVYALSNKLATGQDVGTAGVYRYLGNNFTWSNKAITEVNQAVRRLEPLLKSGNAALTEIGMTRLNQIHDALRATLEQNKGAASMTEEIMGLLPSMKPDGGNIVFKASADEIIDMLENLATYGKVMTGYQYATVTQFNDTIRQLEEFKALGKGMKDVAYTTVKNGQEEVKLVADIAQRAAHDAKILEKLYNVTDNKISKQLRQMIEQGTIGTLSNPFKVADASQLADIIGSFEKGVAATAKMPVVDISELTGVVEKTVDNVDRVTEALRVGATDLSETADMLKQGSKAFSDAVKEADSAIKASTAETTSAAQISYKAATASTEAAEALKAAGEKLQRLDIDDLQKAFNTIQFDPTKRYPSTNPEDILGEIRNLSGERLTAAQGKTNNAFLNFTIQDELGQILYSPSMYKAQDSLVDFFEALDSMAYTGADRIYSSVDFSDILKANIAAMSEVIKAGKISKVSKTLTDEITVALSSLDLGDGIKPAVKEASKQIAKSMYSTGEVTAQELIMKGQSIAKEVGKQLSGGDDATARAIAKAINAVVTNNAESFSKVYSSAADISDELAAGIDKFYGSAGLSDEAFEEASKAIAGAYKSLSDELVKNIVVLTDGDVAAKNLTKVKSYLDDVIDTGIGLTADDVATYLTKSTNMLGHKTNKVYADEISYAIDETLQAATDDIASALKSLTPQIRLSDEVVDLASEGTAALAQARNAAPAAKAGISTGDILFGGITGVGVLDAAALGLDAYFSNKESATMAGNLDMYMELSSRNDETLAGALSKLQANNIELNKLASNGSNWFTAMFGGADLSNAAWESVGANVGITAGQAAGATVTAMLAEAAGYSAGGPAGIAAAVIGGGGSLVYGLTGGDSVGNKYTDAYLTAREQDTIYKNAIEAGLTAAEARAVSDAALKMYRETTFTDLDKSMWKVDEFNKVLYGETSKRSSAAGKLKGTTEEAIANRMLRLEQALGKVPAYGDDYNRLVADSRAQGLTGTMYETDNLSAMIDVLDYIFKDGNYSSEIAEEFFKNFGEQEMEYLHSTEYGKYMEAYDNAQEFVDMLNELGGTNIDLAQLINENKLGSVIQAIIDFKTDFDSSFKNKMDVFKEVTGADGNGFGDNAFIKREAQWVSSDNDRADDIVGEEYVSTFTGMNKEIMDKLKEEYGILVDSTVKSFQNTSGETVKELYSAVSVDYNKLRDNVTGWTLKLPETISLSGASLSATDIEILAQAGIQINSDGTVTFTKAMNSSTTGTSRAIGLTDDMVSSTFEESTAAAGLAIDFSDAEATLNLDIDKLATNMSSALFRLSTAVTGGVSTAAANSLSELGTVLDSGFIEITNKSVLSGEQTVQQYFEGMGYKFDEAGNNIEQSGQAVSEQVVNAFTNIDKVVAQEGSRTAQAVANWADGIVVKAPFEQDELTPEIEQLYATAGTKFVESSNGLMMVINHAGENLKDGVTIIPEELWNKLNSSVRLGLEKIGVTWKTEAGFVKVDISDTLGSLVTTDDIEPVRASLEGLGVVFETTGNRITGILDQNGTRIENGMLEIPNSIWSKVTPETKRALDGLDIKISEGTDSAMLDMNSIVSDGIGEVVALFTAQPDFWNQIPDAVKQTLIDAGIATQEGMLVVNRYMVEGLMPLESGWAGFWENMPQDTRKAFTEAGVATDSGLFKIEESLDGTTIPEGVDGIIMKFDELPPNLQDAIVQSGKAISEKGYLVYNATADVVNNVTDAINDSKQEAIAAANNMATQIEKSVTSALSNIARLENVDVGREYGLVGKKNTKSDMKYITTNGEVKLRYIMEYDGGDGHFVQFHWWDPVTGAEKTGKSLPRLAEGGLGSGTTLVGELGRELAILPDGSMQMLGKRNGELVDLPKGTRVLNNQDTEDVMKYTNNLSGVASVRKLADGNATVSVSGADSLNKVLDIMYNLPAEIATSVRSAIGMKNAGIADSREPAREKAEATKPVLTTELINEAATAIADKLYEVIAPVVANKSDNTQALRPLLVGTLIGDERSMRELSKKLMVIEQEENSRRGGR